jgi:hypothetical protein
MFSVFLHAKVHAKMPEGQKTDMFKMSPFSRSVFVLRLANMKTCKQTLQIARGACDKARSAINMRRKQHLPRIFTHLTSRCFPLFQFSTCYLVRFFLSLSLSLSLFASFSLSLFLSLSLALSLSLSLFASLSLSLPLSLSLSVSSSVYLSLSVSRSRSLSLSLYLYLSLSLSLSLSFFLSLSPSLSFVRIWKVKIVLLLLSCLSVCR